MCFWSFVIHNWICYTEMATFIGSIRRVDWFYLKSQDKSQLTNTAWLQNIIKVYKERQPPVQSCELN